MSRTEVAEYLGLAGVKSLSKTALPRPDVIVGKTKGWSHETIERWNSARPGQGNWSR
ncbi:XRE family transcriptional regulator [Mycolicibacterium mucogenicum]|uniref:XRE family transcriptional regulator n=1 Tax=Mycolicibacterium mucogenicum TaxID=56689 RepID=A0A4R5W9D1_MYCMU|nr:XRE family transcriptional regulator [Mycolicibacterium mucogenicum]